MNDILHYYTATQMRELNRLAIEEHHASGFELMQRAGRAALDELLVQWPETEQLFIFCGTGNGGDGFVIAGLAVAQGLRASVYMIGTSAAIKGDAQKALHYARSLHAPIHDRVEPAVLESKAANVVIVDAMLGTGLAGNVRPHFRRVIEAIINSDCPVLAVDIPSGLCSDTGKVMRVCVKAALTTTFIGRKIGLISGSGPEVCGRVVHNKLGLPLALYRQISGSSNQD